MIPTLTDLELDATRPGAAEVAAWQANPVTRTLFSALRRVPYRIPVPLGGTEMALFMQGAETMRQDIMTMILEADRPGRLVAALPSNQELPPAMYKEEQPHA